MGGSGAYAESENGGRRQYFKRRRLWVRWAVEEARQFKCNG